MNDKIRQAAERASKALFQPERLAQFLSEDVMTEVIDAAIRVEFTAPQGEVAELIAKLQRESEGFRREGSNLVAFEVGDIDRLCTALEASENYKTLYHELLMSVGHKHPNESRHQTALRYIQQAEHFSDTPQMAAQEKKNG